MGRPTKLTPEITKRICDALRAGNFREHAAQWAGVGKTTFYRWLEKGQNATKGEFRDFWDAVLEAETAFVIGAVAELRQAGKDDPKQLTWLLERRCREFWGKNEPQEFKFSFTDKQINDELQRLLSRGKPSE